MGFEDNEPKEMSFMWQSRGVFTTTRTLPETLEDKMITTRYKLTLTFLALILLIGIASAATATFYAISDNADGRMATAGTNATIGTLRNASGSSIINTSSIVSATGIMADSTSNRYQVMYRYGWCADTSSLTGGTVTAATFYVHGEETTSAMALQNISAGLTGFSPTLPTVLALTDYNKTNFVRYSTDKKYNETWNKNDYNAFSINAAGLANVSTTGTTCFMMMGKDDIDNTATELVWLTPGYSIIKTYDTNQAGTTEDPYLDVTYTPASGGSGTTVAFTSNVSSGAPVLGVEFYDTSNIASATGWTWAYKDFGTLPECPFAATSCTPSWHDFSTSHNASYSWGAGNWSIQLTVTNATGPYVSTSYYKWINVSAGNTGSTRLPGNYTFYPADAIWYQNVSALPVHASSATWLAKVDAIDHGYTQMATFLHNSRGQYLIINDTAAPISHQLLSNNNATSSYYDYGSVGGNGGFPIPDDVVTSKTSGSDYPIDLIDTQNNLVYTILNTQKQYNGVFSGSPTIANSSSYCYRFSATDDIGHPDNGCRWLGNKWYTIAAGALTPRYEQNPIWYPSDAGVGLPVLNIRYEEVAAGYINHTIMGTVHLGGSGQWPAVGAGEGTGDCADGTCPPMGAVFRLKSTVDTSPTSGLTAKERVVADAMKTYGVILVNTGSDNGFMLNGYNDTNWLSTDLDGLTTHIQYTDLEFVDVSSLMVDRYSMQTKGIPTSAFTAVPVSGASPLSVSFVDSSLHAPTNWDWYWYANETKSSDLQNPSTTLTTGTYNVRLYTSNTYGGDWENKTSYVTVTSTVCAPVANFTATPLIGDAPLTVTFTDTSTCYPTAWYWIWGGGDLISYAQNPSYTFGTPGLYGIGLAAYNDAGWDSEYKGTYINVTTPASDPLVPDFGGVPIDGGEPLTVQFTDASTGPIVSRLWNFGDGTTSTSEDPLHVYSTQGDYTVTLTIYSTTDSETKTRTDYITVFHVPATPIPTTVAPTPVITPSGSGPQIEGYSSLTSNGVNISVKSSSVYGTDVWLIYGQNRGGYTWITQNYTVTSTSTVIVLQGSPLFGNTAYWARACDSSGCGNEIPFSTAAITPMQTTNYGAGFRAIVGMR